jgi:hypothetical protein
MTLSNTTPSDPNEKNNPSSINPTFPRYPGFENIPFKWGEKL